MARIRLLFSLVVLALLKSSFGKPADQYFHLCRLDHPDFEKCIQKSLTEAQPLLMKGIPEIKLDPFEPLYQSQVNFKEGSGNFRFSLKLTDAYMSGLSKMTVESVKVTGKPDSEMTIKIAIKAPKFSLSSKYSISGRVLVLPVEGTGDLSVNFTQPTLKVTIKGHPIVNKKDGETYLAVDSLVTDMGTKGGRAHFGNLFNGDKTLGRTTNAFFNQNFMDLFASLKHLPQDYFTTSFTKAAKAIFDAWPISELLPPPQ